MKKFISALIGAFAALTIFGTAASAVGGAIGEAFDNAGNAAGDVMNGAGNAVNDLTENGEGTGTGVGHGNVNEATNEATGEVTTAHEGEGTTAAHGTTVTNAATTRAAVNEHNPKTGSFEIVTFGALALSSLAVAASTTRKRK
jgi:hypothetical protein